MRAGAGKPHLMRHHHHGHALTRQRNHHIQHFLNHFRIERTGRFVKQHNLWVHRQCPGDGHPLLLPARELTWKIFCFFRNANFIQQRHADLLGFSSIALAHNLLRQ